MFDAEKERDHIIKWIREWFNENGPTANAVIGISGGKDSTIVAALLVEALGKERVFGVLMPNGKQKDIEDSKKVIEILGIKGAIVDISNAVKGLEEAIITAHYPLYRSVIGIEPRDKTFIEQQEIPEFAGLHLTEDTKINIPPRIRMTTLYAVAQSLQNGGRVANTCNKSEDYIGYSTKYGDSAGDFAPIADYLVTEVKQIGHSIESLKSVAYLIDKVPSDGLCGKTDEDNIGFSYYVLDNFISDGICEDNNVLDNISKRHKLNEHKLKPMPMCKKLG